MRNRTRTAITTSLDKDGPPDGGARSSGAQAHATVQPPEQPPVPPPATHPFCDRSSALRTGSCCLPSASGTKAPRQCSMEPAELCPCRPCAWNSSCLSATAEGGQHGKCLRAGNCLVGGLRDGGGRGGVSWKFWVGGCPTPPPLPGRVRQFWVHG